MFTRLRLYNSARLFTAKTKNVKATPHYLPKMQLIQKISDKPFLPIRNFCVTHGKSLPEKLQGFYYRFANTYNHIRKDGRHIYLHCLSNAHNEKLFQISLYTRGGNCNMSG